MSFIVNLFIARDARLRRRSYVKICKAIFCRKHVHIGERDYSEFNKPINSDINVECTCCSQSKCEQSPCLSLRFAQNVLVLNMNLDKT